MHITKENGKEITEEKHNELVHNALGILSECRRNMMIRAPFTGNVAMNLNIVPVRDQRMDTAATDGKSIYFDIDFLSSLTPDELNFVFAHEVWHCLLAHFLRAEGYNNREILNIAQDLEVNQLLRHEVDDAGSVNLKIPDHAILPEKFNLPPDLSAEQYYDLLMKDNKKTQSLMQLNANNSGSDNGSSGQNSDNSQSSTKSESNNSSSRKSAANTAQNKRLKGQFDKHINESDNLNDQKEQPNRCDRYGKIGHDKNFNPECKKETAEKMREIAVASAQIIEQRNRGELPGHIKQIVKKMMTPEIRWQDVLQNFITRSIGDNANWNRPNKRFMSSGTYLPSRDGEAVNLSVIIDTSGSTARDIPKFLGEINSLVTSFGNYNIHLIQNDTEVQHYEQYNDENPLDLENTEFEIHGNGGTQMEPAFRYIDDNDLECDGIVMLTDGYTEPITDKFTNKPLLTVICAEGTTNEIKYGEVVKLNNVA